MPTFKGNPVTLVGKKIQVGETAPDFKAVNIAMEEVSLHDFVGKRKVISVIPSIDTGVCEFQTRKFNEEVSNIENTILITISLDLPFAQRRWCGASEIENALMLSDYRFKDFGKKYGTLIEELQLLNRAVFILDENNKVLYVEYLEESGNHPQYDIVLSQLK